MEKNLKEEIQEFDKKIETDAIRYKSDLRVLYEEIKKAKESVIKHNKRYEELLEQQKKCEKDLSDIRAEAESNHGYKFAKFQISVTPLEQAERKIEGEKKKLMERIIPEKKTLSVIEGRLNMLAEDLVARRRKVDELEKEKEVLDKQMQDFNSNSSIDFQLVLEDIDNQNQLCKINEEKAVFETLIAKNEQSRLELMKLLASNEELIKKLRMQDVMSDKVLEAAVSTAIKEINELEQTLQTLCKLKEGELPNLILETAKELNIDINKSIFIMQNNIIDAEMLEIVKEESKNLEVIKKNIQLLKDDNASLEEITAEENKYNVMSSLLDEKTQAIDQWKSNMKSILRVDKMDSLPKELLIPNPELLQAITKALKEKGGEEAGYVMKEYFKKLDEREQAVQKVMARIENIRNHVEELHTDNKEYTKKLEVMENEGQKQKTKFRELSVIAKSLENKIKKGEEKINALLKESYKESMKKKGKKANTFNAVKQKDRRQKIRTLYERLREVNRLLETNKDTEEIDMQMQSVNIKM